MKNMIERNEERLKTLISQYQQRVFALILYLIGGDQDKTYDICASSFAEAMRAGFDLEQEDAFLLRTIGISLEKARLAKTLPSYDLLEFIDLPDKEKRPLYLILKSLQSLDFEGRALVLLRNQLNLSYKKIAMATGISESDAKRKTVQALVLLREKVEEILKHGQ